MFVDERNNRLSQDVILLVVSIFFAIFLVRSGVANQLVSSLNGLQWFGIILVGLFFTSFFTIAPSIVLITVFAKSTPLFTLAVLGGLGAMIGDYLMFLIVKDRFSEDIRYLVSFSKGNRLINIFRTHLFKSIVPFVGALIIVSPFPDEIGVAMLGMSKINNKIFLLLSFVLSGVGIVIVGWLGRSLFNY